MFWFVLAHLIAFLVDVMLGTRQHDRDKDLKILVLQHQLRQLSWPFTSSGLIFWHSLG